MPASAAKVVQISSTGESTWGATGAATIKIHGITDASLRVLDVVETVPSVGWYGPSPVALQVSQSGEASFDMVATYEELPRIFNGMFTASASSTDGAVGGTSGPYKYYYEAPVVSTQASYTYTIEYGTSGAAYRAPGSVIKHLNIKGEAGGLWNMTADTVFPQLVVATTGLTSSGQLADRTVNPIRMADTSLRIDNSTGTSSGGYVAVTTQDATLISFELDIESNRHMKTFAGSVYPTSWGDGKYEGSLKLTAEYNTYGKAVVDAMLSTAGSTTSTVKKLIRIANTQTTGVATSTATRAVNLDFAGVLVDGTELFGDRDGNMTIDLTFNGWFSTQLSQVLLSTTKGSNGNWFMATIQNNLATTT